MIEILQFIAIPALVVAGLTFYFRSSWILPPIIITVSFLVLWGIHALGAVSKTRDSEIWNGQVLGKSSERVSCEHSYECNCYSTTDSKGNSTRHCSTCYEHSYDVDWDVQTNIGQFEINRVDRQGLDEPNRWSVVKPGDAVSKVNGFTNYIRGVDFSIFYRSEDNVARKWKGKLPQYPNDVRDYYHLDRFVPVGLTVPDQQRWNEGLEETLAPLGPTKQVNAVVVVVNSPDTEFASALNSEWLGGKKNDVIVVIGTTHYPDIVWVRVLSWTPHNLFKVELRERIETLGKADPGRVTWILGDEIKKEWHRRHMKDFEYLRKEIEPSGWVIGFLWFLSLIAIPGASYYLISNSAGTGDESERRWR